MKIYFVFFQSTLLPKSTLSTKSEWDLDITLSLISLEILALIPKRNIMKGSHETFVYPESSAGRYAEFVADSWNSTSALTSDESRRPNLSLNS